MRQYVAYSYVGLTTLANRRRSDGARLAGRHGIFYQHDGSRWCRITKRDTFGWRDAARCPTVRISRQEKWCLRALMKAGRVGMDER